ncbi:hypothetical protein [Dysgonomonas sp. 520]|nr:hypothetical protein [Dysgonomonas sp. 520]
MKAKKTTLDNCGSPSMVERETNAGTGCISYIGCYMGDTYV